jgi:hypothetical protein
MFLISVMGLTSIVLCSVDHLWGGIDPYTLMALHGPHQTRWPNSPQRAARISDLLGEPCGASRDYLMIKETKSVKIDIVSFTDTAVVID